MKHTEEKLQTEKEEGYQKLKSAEATQKSLEQKITSLSSEVEQLKVDIASLEKNKQEMLLEHKQQLNSLVSSK